MNRNGLIFMAVMLGISGPAFAETTCSEAQALATAKADPEIVKLCPAADEKHGCEFKPRRAGADTAPETAWIVEVSSVYIDDKGQHGYAVDGTYFAIVSKTCKVRSVQEPFKCVSREEGKTCPN